MFGLFRPRCPVPSTEKAWIERRLTWLADTFGPERMTRSTVILPTSEYFPDPYQGSEADVEALLRRVCTYMGVPRERITLRFFQERNTTATHAAGMYVQKEREEIWLEQSQLADPAAVVGILAHELAHVLLLGDQRLSADEEDHELVTDLMTVFLGMGLFGANSAIREKYEQRVLVYTWQISKLGYMSERMYGYAHAVFAWAREETKPPWVSYFRPNVRGPLEEGLHYVAKTGDCLYRPAHASREAGKAVAARRRDLLEQLTSSFSGARVQAVWDLQALPPDAEQIQALLATVVDEDPFVRAETAKSLGRYGAAAAASVPALVERSLADAVVDVRVQALDALSAIGKQAELVVPALASLATDSDFRIRVAAVRALRVFGPTAKEAVPVLVEALGEREDLVAEVLLTLGAIGPDAAEAEPALREMLRGPDRLLRQEVRDALKQIRASA